MLVPLMNPDEVTREIVTDYSLLYHSTMHRLAREYEKERKKLNIDKQRVYCRVYPIKTAAKNNWLFFLRKKISAEKYGGADTLSICPVVYYYNDTGLRVFNCSSPEVIGVYNGHLFSRYNERLQLNLHLPLDAVKHFFRYNGELSYTVMERKTDFYIIGFCTNGFVLGEFENNSRWLVHKTFVSNELIRPGQSAEEKNLFFKYQLELAQNASHIYSNPIITGTLRDKLKAREGFDPD